MTQELEILIDELESVVLELHRTAGHLDNTIRAIRNCDQEDLGKDTLKAYIDIKCRNRLRAKEDRGYVDLDQRELDIWQKIVNVLNE